MLLSRYNLTMP